MKGGRGVRRGEAGGGSGTETERGSEGLEGGRRKRENNWVQK